MYNTGSNSEKSAAIRDIKKKSDNIRDQQSSKNLKEELKQHIFIILHKHSL